MQIPFYRVQLSEEDISGVVDTLRSGWLTTGEKTHTFEERFAQAVGAKYAIAVNSCTAALHLALEAIGLQRGDIVFVPTMTFAATAEVVRYFDAVPIFIDCDETMGMDASALRETIRKILSEQPVGAYKPPYGRLKAVIPMHYGGFVCNMAGINQTAEEFSLTVIEDAAHAFPALYRPDDKAQWINAGKIGKVGCFSFYANKCITTGEGGMAVTDDEQIAQRMHLMSLHGMNKDAWKRFTLQGSWFYEIVAPGFKYNLTDVAAALGLSQLDQAEQFRQKRENIALSFNQFFHNIDAVEAPPFDPSTRIHSWHLYMLRLRLEQLTIDRNTFIDELKARGIICSVHWFPLHLNPYYRETYGPADGVYPNAEKYWPKLVSLPIFPSMTEEEREYIMVSVKEVCDKFHR